MFHLIQSQSTNEKWLWGLSLFLFIIFVGFGTITSFYTHSILEVWKLGSTGQYLIFNIVLSGLAAITQLMPVFQKVVGKFFMLGLFLGLVAIDFFFLNGDKADAILVVPFYFFLPLYLHLLSIFLLQKIWKNQLSIEPSISR